ncbi:MAG: hypothetical protein H7259_07430, partial [Cytophagales bacterium]|nr:hypothetical protein [Cytophaga sp.]
MMKTILLLMLTALLFTANGQVIPGNYDKNYKQGKSFLVLDEFGNALRYLLEAYKVNNTDPQLAYLIGTTYNSNNQEVLSLPYLQKAKEGGIKDKKYEFYFARSYHLQHKFDVALTHYESYKATLKSSDPDMIITDQNIAYCKNGIELIKSPQKVTIQNLGPVVNSPYPDYVPVVSA